MQCRCCGPCRRDRRYWLGGGMTGVRSPSGWRTGGAGTDVTLELGKGMGNGLVAPLGAVPSVSEWLCYTTLRKDAGQWPTFPKREETPWTHGGPPAEYVPTDDDAGETWS